MQSRKEQDRYIIRLERGEEIVGSLKQFCEEHGIGGASFYGLGAAEEIVVARYNIEEKAYVTKNLTGPHELVNITGDVSRKDELGGELLIHAHAVFASADFSAFGGHLKKAIVYATAEIFMQTYVTSLIRVQDPETKLPLLRLL